MVNKIKTFFKHYGKDLLIDVIGLAGLAMLWHGINLYNEQLALIIIGSLLILFAMKANH